MSQAVFFRVLEVRVEQKHEECCAAIESARRGRDSVEGLAKIFTVGPQEFSVIPGSPFAYWVDDTVRRIFRENPPLEKTDATAKQGLATADDFRFLRSRWEVRPEDLAYSVQDTFGGYRWVHFAKGGSYSPYYADVHLAVNWASNGAEIRNFFKPNGRLASRPQNTDFFFRRGLTWPRRTQKGLNVRQFPEGCAFADKGPVIFADDPGALTPLLGVTNSETFAQLVEAQMAFGSYEVGVLQRTPIPADLGSSLVSSVAVTDAFALARSRSKERETEHCFQLPVLFAKSTAPLSDAFDQRQHALVEELTRLHDVQATIEEEVAQAYGLDEPLRAPFSGSDDQRAEVANEESAEYEEEEAPEELTASVANFLMWCVGVAFGRWDVRMARDESLIPELQGPFERLPRVAPGGLVGPDALPATRDRIASEAWLRARPNVISLPEPGSWEGPDSITADEYPVDVAWYGILVDDPDHPRDIVGKVREVLRYVYGPERAQEIEDEALGILRADGNTPRTLRDWFRNQKATELGLSFFDFHIRRYSKSRRKAPIYWRLCTSPGRGQSSYGVWLYYHRLTDDTLWTALNEYVGPKLERERRRADELRNRVAGADGSEARRLEKEREEALGLVDELEWFEAELRKVAEGGWAPDLDDGVVINMAPLHPIVPWNEPEKIWKKLTTGEYDWAKLAIRYWPDRVREKCHSDKSLAIAHNLEDLFSEEDA